MRRKKTTTQGYHEGTPSRRPSPRPGTWRGGSGTLRRCPSRSSASSTGLSSRLSTGSACFVLLFGVVSLFADMTYEGARSITGPYLAVLRASGTVVGIVAGFGELIGYGLRLVSGCLTAVFVAVVQAAMESVNRARCPAMDEEW